eukprot:CAMPEP_0202346010 /NCGR_PEP_ID=MMETSP1126-20121109/4988_1 /ASSEMBLY_ACC=CAM_ASM_000457 /TAXON_ID=3047 /ORGANISM="Dunaliella tertiolecta, Strain CCMP1320" /LENGTH=118 /DNA_ID=CAMNT_0048937365 /DNA_START=125 /DNA_END=481 /DNA_ORIENTATION=+
MTTIACLSYTWGYSEGMHNARTLVRMEQQHNEDVAASVARTEAEHKRTTGHGLSAYKEQQQPQQLAGKPGSVKQSSGHASLASTSSHGYESGQQAKARSGHSSRRHRALQSTDAAFAA